MKLIKVKKKDDNEKDIIYNFLFEGWRNLTKAAAHFGKANNSDWKKLHEKCKQLRLEVEKLYNELEKKG